MGRRTPKHQKDTVLQLIGWLFFLVGTGLFIISSARNGDHLALAGSITFLLGCLVFMAPLVTEVMQRLPNPMNTRIPPMQTKPQIPTISLGPRRRSSHLSKT